MAKHFQCTACGKCCYGQLPLTISDAFANAGRFPLCFIWTPVQQNNKNFRLVKEMGTSIMLKDGKELATLVVPTSFIPSTVQCPALVDGKLCGIHEEKPLRCKTMPFYPYREEVFQAELLAPREGWECDFSEAAPIVYQDKRIVFREDFDLEKSTLIQQVPQIRQYAEYMLKYSHTLLNSLIIAAASNRGGNVVTSLSSFLTATKNTEAKNIAIQQLPVLNSFAAKTADDPKLIDFHRYYTGWAKEMAYLSKA